MVNPYRADPDTAGFFAGWLAGELRICHCASCGHVLHLPRGICDRCRSEQVEWRPTAPAGRLYSWTVVRRPAGTTFETPYTVVLVDLDEAPGVRLLGRLDGAPPLQAGQPMTAVFEHRPGGEVLLNWQPGASAGPAPLTVHPQSRPTTTATAPRPHHRTPGDKADEEKP